MIESQSNINLLCDDEQHNSELRRNSSNEIIAIIPYNHDIMLNDENINIHHNLRHIRIHSNRTRRIRRNNLIQTVHIEENDRPNQEFKNCVCRFLCYLGLILFFMNILNL